jgi:hypothetical protein
MRKSEEGKYIGKSKEYKTRWSVGGQKMETSTKNSGGRKNDRKRKKIRRH